MPNSDSSEPIHIAVACDETYAMPLAAMLASLLAHFDSQRELTIHVLGDDLTPLTWRKLQASESEKRIQWNCIETDTSMLMMQGYSPRKYEHISTASFLRLLLPELLPADLEKVLYLDSDLIVCTDISELWDTDIGDVPLAAVTEWDPNGCKASSPAGVRRYAELGIPPEQPLFNAGVLLLNLTYWRESKLAQSAFAYMRQVGYEMRWYEQEALNVMTDGRYRALEPRWNVPANVAARLPQVPASIVHYMTARKPWHWYYNSAESTLFFGALDLTSWAGWRPKRPRHGNAEQFAAALSKAMWKRLAAIQLMRSKLHSTVDHLRSTPKSCSLSSDKPPPDVECSEIRLFLSAPELNVDLIQTLIAYFNAGIQRAFVLIDSDATEAVAIPDRYAAHVHVFSCQGRNVELALRRLLQRYGGSHWCVLGRLGEVIVDNASSPSNLVDLCAELDMLGSEVLEAVTGDGEHVDLVARDALSNRVFRGSARIAQPIHSYDPPVFVSRVVLVKYASHIMLDAGARVAGNARKSLRCMDLKHLVRPGAP